MTWRVLTGDCLKAMRGMDAGSVDAIVTDPPAGISFMNAGWDHDRGGVEHWIAWLSEVMREALRVAKPGAHALVWALPRTSHWTGTALERAGWEIRDQLHHVFGSGFPKSLDVSKAIDAAAGVEREVMGPSMRHQGGRTAATGAVPDLARYGTAGDFVTAPATPDAARWSGWATALKPAHEVWWLARKPLGSTVAECVLKHGTGGINIEACRVRFASEDDKAAASQRAGQTTRGAGIGTFERRPEDGEASAARYIAGIGAGRWPPNLLLSHDPSCNGICVSGCPVAEMDRQSGELATHGGNVRGDHAAMGYGGGAGSERAIEPSSGGASRFFPVFNYIAKPSRRERDAGVTRNVHPTVKPLKLLDWLLRLIAPPGATILDPFLGSGSTGCAAVRLGFDFIGIEQVGRYVGIAKRRIRAADPTPPPCAPSRPVPGCAVSARLRGTKGNRMLMTFDAMVREVRDLSRLVEPAIARRITALGTGMLTLAIQEPTTAHLAPGTTPVTTKATRHRKRRGKGSDSLWVADARARRVPGWVIKATDGLKTKAAIVDRYGEGARFEVGKPLPGVITAAARKVMQAKGPATNQRQATA